MNTIKKNTRKEKKNKKTKQYRNTNITHNSTNIQENPDLKHYKEIEKLKNNYSQQDKKST